jgi:hypothetical protein
MPVDPTAKPEAAVFQGVNLGEKGIEWHPEFPSCSTFLNVMAIWQAAFGAAVPDIASGYVEERPTRGYPKSGTI